MLLWSIANFLTSWTESRAILVTSITYPLIFSHLQNFNITVFSQKLIELGATDLLVPGVLPIGCFPLYLTLYNTSRKSDYNARTGCLRRYNRLAYHHNRELKQQLDNLQKKYPNTKIMYGDYFKAAMQFVVSPGKFGEFVLPTVSCNAPRAHFGGFWVSDHILKLCRKHVIDIVNYVWWKPSFSLTSRTTLYHSNLCTTMISKHFDRLQVSAQLCKLAAALEGRVTTTSTWRRSVASKAQVCAPTRQHTWAGTASTWPKPHTKRLPMAGWMALTLNPQFWSHNWDNETVCNTAVAANAAREI